MPRWPECKANGGSEECCGHIEQDSNGILACDDCGSIFIIELDKTGDKNAAS